MRKVLSIVDMTPVMDGRPRHSVVLLVRSRAWVTRSEGPHLSLVYFLLIGLAAGWLAGQLVKGHGFGLVENLIIGVIGALIGGFVFGALGVNVGGLLGQLIAA